MSYTEAERKPAIREIRFGMVFRMTNEDDSMRRLVIDSSSDGTFCGYTVNSEDNVGIGGTMLDSNIESLEDIWSLEKVMNALTQLFNVDRLPEDFEQTIIANSKAPARALGAS